MSSKSFSISEVERVFRIDQSVILRAIHSGRLIATNAGTLEKPRWETTLQNVASWLVWRERAVQKAMRSAPEPLIRVQRPRWLGRASY